MSNVSKYVLVGRRERERKREKGATGDTWD